MIYVLKLKRYLFSILLLLFTMCLFVFSSSNLKAAENGLILWATSIVPSLFPFLVATELFSYTDIFYIFGKLFNKCMKPLFNISGEGSFAFIMGIISGYPVGAKIACDFRKNNVLSKTECERLLSFTNNSGPLFIIGTVGISMYGNSLIGFLLFITHILASITVGFLFRFWGKKIKDWNIKQDEVHDKKIISFSKLGEILSDCIYNAISTIMIIGGFIVLFSVIISIFKASKLLNIFVFFTSPFFRILHIPSSFVSPLITGFLEITNGIALISNIHIKVISTNVVLTSFLLGLGGLSIFLQILSIVLKTDLSIKPYIIGKILQAILSAIYTFLFIKLFPFFNFDL